MRCRRAMASMSLVVANEQKTFARHHSPAGCECRLSWIRRREAASSPRSPHWCAARSMVRRISRVRLAAPGRFALAALNQTETRAADSMSRSYRKASISRARRWTT